MAFRADVFSSSSTAAEAVFRWLAFSFCRWPLDAKLCYSSCYFPKCFLVTLLHRSRLFWAQTNDTWLNRINCASPLPGDRSACSRPPCSCGALPCPGPAWASVGGLTHGMAQGLRAVSKGWHSYLHFLVVRNTQVFWILMKPVAGLKYSASDILFSPISAKLNFS